MERIDLKENIPKKDEEILVQKSLNYSTKNGVASTITGAVGDNFISAYAVSLNASNLQIGLLSALPNLVPTELFTSNAMGKFSRKTIVVTGVLLQFLIWPIIALLGILAFKFPNFAILAPTLLIIFYTIYISTGLFIGPAWASWMKDLTENIKLGKYFGLRNKIFGIVSLICIICAGFLLDYFKKIQFVFLGFMLLFLIASVARAISRHYLNKQYEPEFKQDKKYYFSFWQFIKKAPTNNFGRFSIFMGFVNLSVMIAGPFFTPYMLESLKFNYITFTLINLVISGLATLLTMPYWGKFLDKYGCVKTMKTVSWIVSIIPLLWIISPSAYWLGAVQIISGVAWAGFNLAAGTFTYHAVTKERMSLCVAYSSILNGIGVFLGATIGGLITSLPITFMNIFLFVFIISTIARLVIMNILLPKIIEVKPVKIPHSLFNIILRPFRNVNHFVFGHVLSSLYPFFKFSRSSHAQKSEF